MASIAIRPARVRHAGQVPHGCRRPSLVVAATLGNQGLLPLPGSCRTAQTFATTMPPHLWPPFACRVLGLNHGCKGIAYPGEATCPAPRPVLHGWAFLGRSVASDGSSPRVAGLSFPKGGSVAPRMPQMVTNRFQMQIQGVKSQHEPGQIATPPGVNRNTEAGSIATPAGVNRNRCTDRQKPLLHASSGPVVRPVLQPGQDHAARVFAPLAGIVPLVHPLGKAQ